MDLEIKKTKYYSYYDATQKYNINFLYEFDPTNLEADSYISWHMYYCKHNPYIFEKLPDKLDQLIKHFINQHKQYNISNGYPIEYIDQNLVNLSIQYQSNFSFFDDCEFSATYTPVENVIG